jgi:hypothetical protein
VSGTEEAFRSESQRPVANSCRNISAPWSTRLTDFSASPALHGGVIDEYAGLFDAYPNNAFDLVELHGPILTLFICIDIQLHCITVKKGMAGPLRRPVC